MFYKKAIALSVAVLMLFSVGCGNNAVSDGNASEGTTEIYVPEGSRATNGDITIVNGDMGTPPTEAEKVTINLGLYDSAAALSAGHLLENNATGVAYEKYNCKLYSNAEQTVQALENGEIDVASLPIDSAVNLYVSSKGSYQIAMVNSTFIYCIAQNGDTVTDLASLAGKTVTVAENDKLGTAVLNKLLSDYGVQDCTINTVADTAALVDGLVNGSVKLAITQEPYMSEATAKNAAVTMGLDLYDSWNDKSNTNIVTGCIVVSNGFTLSERKAFVYFLKDYEASVNLTRKNIAESSQLAEKYKLTASAATAKSALPGCSVSADLNDDMETKVTECINFLNSVDSAILGGASADTKMFFKQTSES